MAIGTRKHHSISVGVWADVSTTLLDGSATADGTNYALPTNSAAPISTPSAPVSSHSASASKALVSIVLSVAITLLFLTCAIYWITKFCLEIRQPRLPIYDPSNTDPIGDKESIVKRTRNWFLPFRQGPRKVDGCHVSQRPRSRLSLQGDYPVAHMEASELGPTSFIRGNEPVTSTDRQCFPHDFERMASHSATESLAASNTEPTFPLIPDDAMEDAEINLRNSSHGIGLAMLECPATPMIEPSRPRYTLPPHISPRKNMTRKFFGVKETWTEDVFNLGNATTHLPTTIPTTTSRSTGLAYLASPSLISGAGNSEGHGALSSIVTVHRQKNFNIDQNSERLGWSSVLTFSPSFRKQTFADSLVSSNYDKENRYTFETATLPVLTDVTLSHSDSLFHSIENELYKLWVNSQQQLAEEIRLTDDSSRISQIGHNSDDRSIMMERVV
ncbi:hypothetical protein BU17DRAFT_100979 [Hysterangium stoloniferum]|nr:hypothetical protein BU17DRAFT_100979 [Hysterangium stoloniferum]